jgi:ankyrin repeat protein
MTLSRRTILEGGILMAAGALVGAPSPLQSQSSQIPDRGPRLDQDLVREFVIAGHANLEKTKELLEKQPALVNATWDWGGGDWETALGGASHMGSREVAEYLLSKGARMDVFCAAMLGRIDIVKAFLAADPNVVHLKGPHGIPLLRHAKAGKQDAVVELLIAHGAKA